VSIVSAQPTYVEPLSAASSIAAISDYEFAEG
jgi:hypothetical protein